MVRKFENKYVAKSEKQSIKGKIFSEADSSRAAQFVKRDNPRK